MIWNKKLFYIIIAGLFIVALFLRINAGYANLPYGNNIWLFTNSAQSIAERGDMKVSTNNPDYQFYPVHTSEVSVQEGEYLNHNPLWPILGAGVIEITGMSAQKSLISLSILLGVGVVWLLYILGTEIWNEKLGLFIAVLSSFSYILIDFSGNGSFYILQAFLYLLFLYVLLSDIGKYKPVLLGVIAAAGILVVHQSVALIATYLLYLVLFEREKAWHAVKKFLIFSGIIILFYLPWGIRNILLFNSFFPSADTYYIWEKLGVEKSIQNGIVHYKTGFETITSLIKKVVSDWFPNNLYYINRQLFILAPLIYIFALLLSVEVFLNSKMKRFDKDKLKNIVPIFLVLFFHVLISAAWPVPKFRYFVAMVPLVLLLGGYYLFQLLSPGIKRSFWLTASIVVMIVLSVLTYIGSPSRIYYNGGVLTTDPFGKQQTIDYVENYKQLIRDPGL